MNVRALVSIQPDRNQAKQFEPIVTHVSDSSLVKTLYRPSVARKSLLLQEYGTAGAYGRAEAALVSPAAPAGAQLSQVTAMQAR